MYSFVIFFSLCSIAQAQNVGIGASNPRAKLHILSNTNGAHVQVLGTDNVNATWRLATPSNQVVAFGGNSDHNIDFGYFDNANTSFTSRFRIERITGNVGIGTTTPSNKLDVNGYIEVGTDVTGGADVEGAMRYNTTKKCIEFYDGSSWRCAGEPYIQTFSLRDGVNSSLDGAGSNITNWNTSGYGYLYSFTVNNCRAGSKILFLIEQVTGTGDRRANGGYLSSHKLYGNGVWMEKEIPLVGNDETMTAVFWGTPNTSGNLSFHYENNSHETNVRITAIVF